MGVKMHFNTRLEEFLGDSNGKVRGVRTSEGELPADLVVICTKKTPRNDLAAAAGIQIGSTGGIIVDERMATSATGVWAAGDCIEVPHGVSNVPLQGLSGATLLTGKGGRPNAPAGAASPARVCAVGNGGRKWRSSVSPSEGRWHRVGNPFVLGKARHLPSRYTLTEEILLTVAEPEWALIGASGGLRRVKERPTSWPCA